MLNFGGVTQISKINRTFFFRGWNPKRVPKKMDQTSVFLKTVRFLLPFVDLYCFSTSSWQKLSLVAKLISNESSCMVMSFGSAGKTCSFPVFQNRTGADFFVPLQFKTYFSLHDLWPPKMLRKNKEITCCSVRMHVSFLVSKRSASNNFLIVNMYMFLTIKIHM